MHIKKISTRGFRNLSESSEIELPSKGVLVAAAPNAFGKTNFLESVAVLLRGKSFRARISDCVSWDSDSFILDGDIENGDGDIVKVAVRYHVPSRKLRVEEGGEVASIVSFYAHYPFVLFLPEDTFLFSRGPAGRRNFLNHALVVHQGYLSALVQYHRVLKQRNLALKRSSSASDIGSWTELLVEHAAVVWRHRESFVEYIDSSVNDVYYKLSGEKKDFEVRLSMGASSISDFKKELDESYKVERKYGHTLYGPHRDDFVVTTGGRSVENVLSRGQCRSLVVSLKVLTHRYVKQLTGDDPILLLDDIFSELDEDRQVALLENLPETQIILTCTAVPRVLRGRDDVYLLDLRTVVRSDVEKKDDLGEGEEDEAGDDYSEVDINITEPKQVAVAV